MNSWLGRYYSIGRGSGGLTVSLLSCFFMIALWLAPTCRADQTAAKQILHSIQQEMAQIETVQADFVQRKKLAMFDRELTIIGRMAVQPLRERVAWHVSEPVRYSMVIQGTELEQWDEDTDRVRKLRLDRDPAFKLAIDQLTVWFSGRYLDLLADYSLVVEQEDPLELIFRPLETSPFAQLVDQIRVVFRQDKRYLHSLEIREGAGDITKLEFSGTKLNQPIDHEWWQVRP